MIPVTVEAPGRVRALPPAKLNLFLEIQGRRDDGYHDLTTLFVPVDWRDELEFVARPVGSRAEDDLELVEGTAPGGPDDLTLRAVRLLRDWREFPAVRLRLHKRIPLGAGLGGGSADAAATLLALDALFGLRLSAEELHSCAARLGADVPFFLGAGPAVGGGRGDRLRPLAGTLFGGRARHAVIAVPPVRCATAAVFAHVTLPLTSPDGPITFPERTFVDSSRPVADLEGALFNRLEAPAMGVCEGLAAFAGRLRAETGASWSMSGSGSTFFSLCDSRGEAVRLARGVACWPGLCVRVAPLGGARRAG